MTVLRSSKGCSSRTSFFPHRPQALAAKTPSSSRAHLRSLYPRLRYLTFQLINRLLFNRQAVPWKLRRGRFRSLCKRKGSRKRPDRYAVRQKSRVCLPMVQEETRRFDERSRLGGRKGPKCDRRRRTWRSAKQSACKTQLHLSVHMTADDSLDRRISRNDSRQPMTASAAIGVEIWHATSDRRLVHHNQGGPTGVTCEHSIKPAQGFIIDISMMKPGQRHV